MSDLPFPLAGSTLIVGPSNTGKTRLTARALETWIEREGTEGLVVLDFAPELERDGRLLGGRLDRFTAIPDDGWVGRLEAHAPRASAGSQSDAVALAEENAERADQLLDAAPAEPRAVFVNDATIPRQHDADAPHRVRDYCDRADVAVLNALESDELGADHPVSRVERATVAALREWATRTVSLSRGSPAGE
ncbi:hypothetical protein SAMN05216559_0074 [Halomicrobium zhouii]|uniref:Uncharacterized protein n=1 Tax=Halomicrobium zhouii TaxID=767519 RepID=A0A1I6K2L6_9EURY|nr:hypothetical protein [Halomicrobium zhouii]SFR85338.1 hypothetical protein SAMN05216559_0074 [Halomicrobium zhouii]